MGWTQAQNPNPEKLYFEPYQSRTTNPFEPSKNPELQTYKLGSTHEFDPTLLFLKPSLAIIFKGVPKIPTFYTSTSNICTMNDFTKYLWRNSWYLSSRGVPTSALWMWCGNFTMWSRRCFIHYLTDRCT